MQMAALVKSKFMKCSNSIVLEGNACSRSGSKFRSHALILKPKRRPSFFADFDFFFRSLKKTLIFCNRYDLSAKFRVIFVRNAVLALIKKSWCVFPADNIKRGRFKSSLTASNYSMAGVINKIPFKGISFLRITNFSYPKA